MAQLTLANLIDEVQDEIQNKPQAKIVRALNKVIRRIYHEPPMWKRGTFTTSPKVVTGTVSVTLNSTTATFSSAILATTDPLTLVQIEGDQAWFTLTPSNTTVGALSSVWPTTTDATATFTLVRPSITFPSDVGEIMEVGRDNYEPLSFARDEFRRAWPSAMAVGVPELWFPYLHDSSGTPDDKLRIVLVPAPDTRMVYSYSYRARPTFIAADAATTVTVPLPDVWNEAVIAGVLAYLWKQEDAAGLRSRMDLYEGLVARTRARVLPAATIKPRIPRRALAIYSNRPSNG